MKWGYDLRNSDCWQNEWFDEKSDAVRAALDEVNELNLDVEFIRVGQLCKHVPNPDFDYVIENAAERAYDECGEIAESWLNQKHLDKQIVSNYQDKLNDLFNQFLIEVNEVHSFGRIVNVEKVSLVKT